MLTGNICCFGLAGVDGIFVALCLHISAQFQTLEHDFAQLTPVNKSGTNIELIQLILSLHLQCLT